MSPKEYAQWRKKEAEIGACWLIVTAGLFGLFTVQILSDSASPLTVVIAVVFLAVLVAGLVDDIWGRGKKNRAIRAEHAHLRRTK